MHFLCRLAATRLGRSWLARITSVAQSCLCSTSSIVPSMAPQRELNSQDETMTWLSHRQHPVKFRSTNSWSNKCMLFTKDKCGFRVRCSTRNLLFFVRMERERGREKESERGSLRMLSSAGILGTRADVFFLMLRGCAHGYSFLPSSSRGVAGARTGTIVAPHQIDTPELAVSRLNWAQSPESVLPGLHTAERGVPRVW